MAGLLIELMHIFVWSLKITDYQNFSNLKDSNGTSIGYVAKLDENSSCGQVPITLPWVVKSEQTSTDSPLNIEMINYQCPLGDLSNCVTMINSKMTLTEEDSASNPYGILTFDYFYGTRPDSNPLYLATYESKKVDNKIQFQSAIFVDCTLINKLLVEKVSSTLQKSFILLAEEVRDLKHLYIEIGSLGAGNLILMETQHLFVLQALFMMMIIFYTEISIEMVTLLMIDA